MITEPTVTVEQLEVFAVEIVALLRLSQTNVSNHPILYAAGDKVVQPEDVILKE